MKQTMDFLQRNQLRFLFLNCILLLVMAHYANDTVNIIHPRFTLVRFALSIIGLVVLSILPVLTKRRGDFKFARNMSWFWLVSTILMILALPERDCWCPELTSMHEPLGVIIVVVGFTFFSLLFPVTAMLIDPYDTLSRSMVLEWHIMCFLVVCLIQLVCDLWVDLKIHDVMTLEQFKAYLSIRWTRFWSWSVI